MTKASRRKTTRLLIVFCILILRKYLDNLWPFRHHLHNKHTHFCLQIKIILNIHMENSNILKNDFENNKFVSLYTENRCCCNHSGHKKTEIMLYCKAHYHLSHSLSKHYDLFCLCFVSYSRLKYWLVGDGACFFLFHYSYTQA